jgi:5-(carboxyamino)imidazole ribonucleotide synthase
MYRRNDSFKNRIAVIIAETLREKSYPVVEMEFHPSNQVEYVICPARIDDKVADKARANCTRRF